MPGICGVEGCDRPTNSGTCSRCDEEVERALADVPALGAELLLVLARLTRYGDRDGYRGSVVQPLPYDTRAASLRSDATSTLSAWARVIWSPFEPSPPGGIAPTAGWVLDRFDRLRRIPDVVQAYDELSDLVDRMRTTIDRPPDRQFVGVCSTRNGPRAIPCEEHLYARLGAPSVRCPVCGTTHDVAERLEVLRIAVRDVLARPVEIRRAVSWLGEAVREDQLSRWVRGGRLLVRGHDRIGVRVHALYRIGDVLDLLADSVRARGA